MRILVVGRPGSGKTVLTRRLGRELDLPTHHLAVIEERRTGSDGRPAQQLREQRAITSGAGWVIDGTHLPTLPARLPRADTVVLLDPPLPVALRTLLRRFRRGHPGSPPRVRHLLYAAGFRSRVRPRILQAVREHAPHVRLLTAASWRQAEDLVAVLAAEGGASARDDQPAGVGGRAGAADPRSQQHPT